MSEEGGFGCSRSDIKSLSLSLSPVYQRVPRHKQAALHQLRRQHAVGAAVKGHEPLDVLHVLSLGWNLQCVAKPDGYNFYQTSQRLAILEFFRAMDSSEDWEEKKDAEKGNRYAPVFGILQLDQLLTGETGVDHDPLQLHTVGVRGSISNVDRTESLPFLSTLKALGITSRINLETIRKVVAKRTFVAVFMT